MKIILDTNFLMIPYSLKVDIFSEIDRLISDAYALCIFEGTLKELKSIMEKQRGKHKLAAKFALDIIEKKKLTMLPSTKSNVDRDILALAKDTEILVATQDGELKRVLKALGRKCLVLRQKSHLILA